MRKTLILTIVLAGLGLLPQAWATGNMTKLQVALAMADIADVVHTEFCYDTFFSSDPKNIASQCFWTHTLLFWLEDSVIDSGGLKGRLPIDTPLNELSSHPFAHWDLMACRIYQEYAQAALIGGPIFDLRECENQGAPELALVGWFKRFLDAGYRVDLSQTDYDVSTLTHMTPRELIESIRPFVMPAS